MRRMKDQGDTPVILDVLLGEAVSVICRRARERRVPSPDLRSALGGVRWAMENERIRWIGGAVELFASSILEVIEETSGVLNFNDALLVVLQREGVIGEVATFDEGFAMVPTFRRVS